MSYLIVNKVNSTHNGTVRVQATNKVGSVEDTFELNVIGN